MPEINIQIVQYLVDRKDLEHSKWVNTTQEALDFLKRHPEHYKDYQYYKMKSEIDNKEILVEKFKVCTNKFVTYVRFL